VSRWSLDEVRIGLAPERVILQRVRRGWQPRVLAQQALDADPAGEAPWAGALGALARALEAREWRRATARAVLSDRLLRYAAVPWSERLADRAETAEVAAAQLRAIHGERADGWTVRVSEGRYRAAWLAAGVDSELLARLAALCESARLGLTRVAPFFAAACNRFRRSLREPALWFAALEGGRLTAARRDAAGWQGVASVRVAGDPRSELTALVDRHDLLHGAPGEPAPLYLYAPGACLGDAPVGAAGHPLRPLEAGPGADAGLALAEVL
jgi:hypothetical protein